jgi:tetraacyldisaccharide 4'-kinase
MDDGFQHRRIARACDVVLLHARMPLGGWPLFPRGPMREPIEAIRRAHLVILTRSDEVLEKIGAWRERVRALNPSSAFASAVHQPIGLIDAATGERLPVSHLSGKRVLALSSVGDPRGFENTLIGLHGGLLAHRAFPDHHAYQPHEWQALLESAKRIRADALVTTEKDWVRLSFVAGTSAPQLPVWLLQVRLSLRSGEEELDARLAGL